MADQLENEGGVSSYTELGEEIWQQTLAKQISMLLCWIACIQ